MYRECHFLFYSNMLLGYIFIYLYIIFYILNMKTSIDLPEELIDEAMRISGSKSKIEAIKRALKEMIERERRLKLLNFKGKVDLEIDLDSSRNRVDIL